MDLIEKLVDMEKLKDYHFLLELVIILVAVKLAGHFSKKIGQPSYFGSSHSRVDRGGS